MTPTTPNSPDSPVGLRTWQKALLLVLFWALPGVLFALQIFFMYRVEDREAALGSLILWQVSGWLFWAFATPGVLWLGRRFPVARRRWLRPLLAHLGCASLITVLVAGWNTAATYLAAPEPYSSWPLANVFAMWLLLRFHLVLLIYGGILGIGYGLDYYRKYRERELQASQLETQLAQAQLQALKMQLHPHFLFNTMHAISVLVRKGENRGAVRMLAGLSDLLRMALDNDGHQEVSLRQELDFLRRYLDLEQIRFQDRLRIDMQIAPEALAARVPNLILQPLVENAIRHGIGPTARSGLVAISARRDSDRLRVEVRDDGPGLAEAELAPAREGVGVSNTRMRLQRLYGDRQRFTLANAGAGGTVATLEIPFLTTSAGG